MQKQSFANVLQVFFKIFFRKFHRKTPGLESLFNKAAGLKALNFVKKWLQHSYFPVKLPKFLRTPFLTEHLRWLLLSMLLFMNVSSFTSPLPHFHYFLAVLLLSSFEETLSSLYHYYYIINITIVECSPVTRIATTPATYSKIVIRISTLMDFMLKRKKITYE